MGVVCDLHDRQSKGRIRHGQFTRRSVQSCFRLSEAALLDKLEDNYNISAKDFKQFVRWLIGCPEEVASLVPS